LPKYAPTFLKELAREQYILVEIEPNDSRISSERVKEHINHRHIFHWDSYISSKISQILLDKVGKGYFNELFEPLLPRLEGWRGFTTNLRPLVIDY